MGAGGLACPGTVVLANLRGFALALFRPGFAFSCALACTLAHVAAGGFVLPGAAARADLRRISLAGSGGRLANSGAGTLFTGVFALLFRDREKVRTTGDLRVAFAQRSAWR